MGKRVTKAKKIGRPSKRSPSVIARIVEGLSAGTPLTVICKPNDMPSPCTVREWMDGDEALSIAIARARETGFDAIAEEALNIAEETPQRTATQFGDKVDPGFVQHQRNRIETRLKLLAKWDPKRYGDRQHLDHTSSDGSMSPPKTLADFYGERSDQA